MARTKALFNEGWFFSKEAVDPKAPAFETMEAVSLPHTWNAFDGQDGGNDYYRGLCWYARRFPKPQGEKLWLEFGAVSQIAEVYVNGTKLTRHEAGFSIFRAELTDHLVDGENIVVVSADNSANDYTYPQMADFTFYGGIYRDVFLISTAKEHFDLDWHGAPGIAVTPSVNDDGSATVAIRTWAKNSRGAKCRIAIGSEAEAVLDAKDGVFETAFTLQKPHLWNGVQDPFLYEATAQLVDANGTVLDEISAKFGVRSYSVDPDKGFVLNGVPTPLHGVSRHQCREDKGWAQSREDERQDIELITEMGANSIRLAHYQHSQSFYDLCDEFGVVVWAEIPFISRFMNNPAAKENTLLQMKELVVQSINHPSICFWGVSNEITIGGDKDPDLLENQRALNDLCHQLDPSRLTTIANLSMVNAISPQNEITDTVAFNHYFGWYFGDVGQNAVWFDDFREKNPRKAVGLSEYGAEGNINLHSETPQVRDYSEEYQCVYHEALLETFATRPWIWGTYVWNMFEFGSDMRNEGMVAGRNNKGLVNFSRTVKKDAYFAYKAHWTTKPFVYLCGRRFLDRCGDTTGIKVYATGVDQVALLVNGTEAARKPGKHVFTFDAALNMGVNKVCAVGFAGGKEICREEISLNRVSEPNPNYSMPKGAGTANSDSIPNWFDADYADKELTFNEGYFSVKDTFGVIMANGESAALVMEIFQSMMEGMIGGKEGGGIIEPEALMAMLTDMNLETIMMLAGDRVPGGTLEMVNAKLQEIKK